MTKPFITLTVSFFLAIVFLFSCSPKNHPSTEPVSDTELDIITDTLLMINRGGCRGFCPMDKTLFMTNGDIYYLGLKHVDAMGKHTSKINQTHIDSISLMLDQIDFFNLHDRYPVNIAHLIADFPTTTLYGKIDGRRKLIRNTHDAPQGLNDFQTYVIGLIGSLEMNKVEE